MQGLSSVTKRVSVVLFQNFTTLDAFGPIQVFGSAFKLQDNERIPRYHISTIAHKTSTILSGEGQIIHIDRTFDELLKDNKQMEDILLIPGGFGTRTLVNDASFIQDLGKICKNFKIVASVCTGSALLAKTGLLDGKTATSNKMAWDWVTSQRNEVNWQRAARWIDNIDKKTGEGIITSAGVSAGIDMTLAIVQLQFGDEAAHLAAKRMEYLWNSNSSLDLFA